MESYVVLVEVKADDTKAIVAVVNADTKRLALLEECERLQLAAERGKSTTEDEERIKEVCMIHSLDSHTGPTARTLDVHVQVYKVP